MARSSKVGLLGLLVLASSASATTVGDLKGRPLAGQALEVNIPFAVDEPRDKACASASVRYGGAPVRSTLHVQGSGLKRNLLVTSRAKVSDEPVTVNVRAGCGSRAVTRRFVMATGMTAAKAPPMGRPAARPAAFRFGGKPVPGPVALLPAGEPLFPPAAPEALPHDSSAQKADASLAEELRQARTDAAAAITQLDAARKELAAVLDVERRTQQTLIHSGHQIQDAQSEAARMRLVLKWVGAVLTLGAAGLVWWEVQRVAFRRRTARARPPQEPTILSSGEMPA
ncbi:MAG TPA: hypothetical protein VF522_09990 [Ramlibacter sp.]|uniref:hypothetical protein n=1 Tax=Ramlibacter sp. TaxID=1917967 RepID=UPI002ED1977E